MISTGHNRSIRIWDFGTKKCVYENTTHRYKHDESIHAARFHPGAAYYASAGADAIVRVYC
jgi:striatin 1/3/4